MDATDNKPREELTSPDHTDVIAALSGSEWTMLVDTTYGTVVWPSDSVERPGEVAFVEVADLNEAILDGTLDGANGDLRSEVASAAEGRAWAFNTDVIEDMRRLDDELESLWTLTPATNESAYEVIAEARVTQAAEALRREEGRLLDNPLAQTYLEGLLENGHAGRRRAAMEAEFEPSSQSRWPLAACAALGVDVAEVVSKEIRRLSETFEREPEIDPEELDPRAVDAECGGLGRKVAAAAVNLELAKEAAWNPDLRVSWRMAQAPAEEPRGRVAQGIERTTDAQPLWHVSRGVPELRETSVTLLLEEAKADDDAARHGRRLVARSRLNVEGAEGFESVPYRCGKDARDVAHALEAVAWEALNTSSGAVNAIGGVESPSLRRLTVDAMAAVWSMAREHMGLESDPKLCPRDHDPYKRLERPAKWKDVQLEMSRAATRGGVGDVVSKASLASKAMEKGVAERSRAFGPAPEED